MPISCIQNAKSQANDFVLFCTIFSKIKKKLRRWQLYGRVLTGFLIP